VHPDFSDPIAQIVNKHQADHKGNQDQVDVTDEIGNRGLPLSLDNMNWAKGEAAASPGMTRTAGRRKIRRMNRGIRIRGGQNLMNAVATATVGHGLGAGPAGQAVEAGVKAQDAVGRETKTRHQLQVAVTHGAGFTNAKRAGGRLLGGRALDVVLPVTVAADGSLAVPRGDSLPVNASAKFVSLRAVTHATGFHRVAAKGRRSRACYFVGIAMTDPAIGSSFVAGLALLAMDPQRSLVRLA
jgi:hypothetical protein